MIDRVKVIKGLECCKASTNYDPFQQCSECPYNDISISVQECRAVLSTDALALLKEQEAVEPILIREGRNKHYNDYVCPRCGNEVVYEQNYCSECGVEFLWEGR